MTTFTHRPYEGGDDYWKVRSLLIETYPISPVDYNWDIRHWDGEHFHRAAAPRVPLPNPAVHLWETAGGKLVGVAHPEGSGNATFELHPDYRPLVEEDMLAWAEEHLSMPAEENGPRQLNLFAYEYDLPRRRLLERRGWQKTTGTGVSLRMRLGCLPLPEPSLAPGYTLRTTRPDDESDCQRIADVLNRSFHRTFHSAPEYRAFSTLSPSFRHDLNLVAEAPDGSFAAHVGVTYDEANRHGIFEPVCTDPAHLRKNLARSLMFEGLHRLKALGAEYAHVQTGSAVPANRLYEAVGFTEVYLGYYWEKKF